MRRSNPISTARALAEQLDDDSLRAQAERWIAALYGRRQQLDEAVAHAAQAIAIYERLAIGSALRRCAATWRSSMFRRGNSRRRLMSARRPTRSSLRYATHTLPQAIRPTTWPRHRSSWAISRAPRATPVRSSSLGHRSTVPYARFTLGQIDLAHCKATDAIDQLHCLHADRTENDDPLTWSPTPRARSARPSVPPAMSPPRASRSKAPWRCSASSISPAKSPLPSSCWPKCA